MTHSTSGESALPPFARQAPALGDCAYQLTFGPRGHRHAYYAYDPWSPDGRLLAVLQYEPTAARATIAVLDMHDGSVRPIAETAVWRGLLGAGLQWVRCEPRTLVWEDHDGNSTLICTAKLDGDGSASVARFPTTLQMHMASMHGRAVFARTGFAEQFPAGAVAGRTDTGLFRFDLDTGGRTMVASLDDCLALHPRRDEVRTWHLFLKQVHAHRVLDWVFFVFGNDAWFSVVPEENPMVKSVYVCREDGSELTYIGDIGRHPSWDVIEPRVYFGTRAREGDGTRLDSYTYCDGEWKHQVHPGYPVWSHPQVHRTLPLVVSETYGVNAANKRVLRIAVAHRETGELSFVAENESDHSTTHVALDMKHDRSVAGLVRSLERGRSVGDPIVMEPCPVWSPCGRWILFTGEVDGLFQLFGVPVGQA